MAVLTASACQTNASGFLLNPPKYIERGMIARTVTYTFVAAQSAGDVIMMVPVPRGAQINDLIVQGGFVAGSGSITVTPGDGGVANRFGSLSAVNVAVHATLGIGYTYSADDTIDLAVTTVTTATATGSVRLSVFYSMDGSTDGS